MGISVNGCYHLNGVLSRSRNCFGSITVNMENMTEYWK